LKTSLEALVDQVIDAVRNDGVRIIILDDSGFDKTHKTIPMAMAVGRISRALLEAKIRHLTSIVASTSEVIDSHGAATLIAYGASAVYPSLLFATAASYIEQHKKRLTVPKRSNRSIMPSILGF
jgi:glutamate synthase (NADPH) large chain